MVNVQHGRLQSHSPVVLRVYWFLSLVPCVPSVVHLCEGALL